jgi:hypothetical protein
VVIAIVAALGVLPNVELSGRARLASFPNRTSIGELEVTYLVIVLKNWCIVGWQPCQSSEDPRSGEEQVAEMHDFLRGGLFEENDLATLLICCNRRQRESTM